MYNTHNRQLGQTPEKEPSWWESLLQTGVGIYQQVEALKQAKEQRQAAEEAARQAREIQLMAASARALQTSPVQSRNVVVGGGGITDWMLPIGIGAVALVGVMAFTRKRR